MKTIAKALIQSVKFLEYADDKILDQDSAVAAMELISCTLKHATPDELRILQKALDEEIQEANCSGATVDEISFYKNFLENLGISRV